MKQGKKQPAVTRQAILSAAGSLFSTQGYAGTGIGAIVEETGLTKGALFHHFPDKRSLARDWVRHVLFEELRADWMQPLGGMDSLDGFRSFCSSRCLSIQPNDSLAALTALTAEVASSDDVLRAELATVVEAWQEAIGATLKRGQGAGWIHPSIQPEMEAGVIVSMFSGFSVLSKCTQGDGFQRSSAKALEGYLDTLRPQ